MRVGVVTGEVAVTVGATAEGMVAGDAVNTAARVQSTAEPGTVWVDEATRSLTAAAISYSDTGEHALKGKAEPIRLWQARAVVAEVGGGQRVDGLEAPLTGRDRDLRLLKELFHATQESQRPRLVVVDGEAGRRQVTAGLGVREVRRRPQGDDPLAPRPVPVLRRRRGLLGAGRGAAYAARAGRGRLRRRRPGSARGILQEFVPAADERDWLRPRLAALVGAGAVRAASRARTCSPRGRRSSSGSARTATPSCSSSTTRSTPTTACSTSSTTCWAPPGRRSSSSPWPGRSCSCADRRSVVAGRLSCASTRSTTRRWPALVDGLVVGLPAASPYRPGRARRGHPAVRRRDGPRAHRP